MKVSSSRVSKTRYLPDFSMRSRRRLATSSTMSFSASPLGALVPVSMPPCPGSSTTRGRGSGNRPPIGLRRGGGRILGAGDLLVLGDLAQKTVAVGRGEVEHQPRRRAVGGIHDEGLVDADRLGDVEHQPRAAGHDQAVAEGLDQTSSAVSGIRRQLKPHLRNIDDDAVGIGERKDVQIDLAVEVHDEAGLRLIAANARVGCHRK